jgi:hypothetical protein
VPAIVPATAATGASIGRIRTLKVSGVGAAPDARVTRPRTTASGTVVTVKSSPTSSRPATSGMARASATRGVPG